MLASLEFGAGGVTISNPSKLVYGLHFSRIENFEWDWRSRRRRSASPTASSNVEMHSMPGEFLAPFVLSIRVSLWTVLLFSAICYSFLN